ncbi:dolichyl-phosphate-mannose-protein mannosyltransferase [Candidatus Magnetoovum chiemensis]|nr:dolichyl-phosphate-mannose-protein mannosyltransferase [Candidatus Magnetoovum chiemensis]
MERSDRRYALVLSLALAILSLFRFYYIVNGPIDLSPDEAHYWEWSRRLDISYYSKGPLIAYLIYVGAVLFGDTVFAVRYMAVVMSALTSIIVYRLVIEMYRDRAVALVSALLLQVVPMFSTYAVVFTIDAPFTFLWTLCLYLSWRAVNYDRNGYFLVWAMLGLAMGFGLLAKYTMAFFHLCALLFLAFTKKRALLRTIKPYIAVVVSAVVFSPVVYWNYKHGWVTVKHTAGQAHVHDGVNVSLSSFFEFLGSQVGIVTPALFIMIFYAIYKLKRYEKGIQSDFLFYFSMPVMAFFLAKSVQGKVQANWAMTAYITGLIAFAKVFFTARFKFLTGSAVGLAFILTAVSHYPMMLGLNPELDPSSKLRGWSELGQFVDEIYDDMKTKGNVLIFSDKYQVSSELAFYMKDHPEVYCIRSLGRRMNQYDLWSGIKEAVENMRKIDPTKPINGIFVRIGADELPDKAKGFFRSCQKTPFNVFEGENLLRDYSIFVCEDYIAINDVEPESF